MKLRFKYYKRKYKKLNGKSNMSINKIDLCRHTMQVGYKNAASFSNASIYRHIELFCMVMAYVNYKNGKLSLKNDYFELDQSEKVCVSYQLGQGLTKAIAERYFDVPWVAHVKIMKSCGNILDTKNSPKIVINSKEKRGKEADLIGYDTKGYVHLFESKGSYAKKMESEKIQRAINQVSYSKRITDPSGKTKSFATRNACLFNFTPCFHGLIIDPPIDYKGDEKSTGLLYCLYNYYYFSLFNNTMKFETIKKFNREWNGYIFSFNGEEYFWGINSLYKEFLLEQLKDCNLNGKSHSYLQNKDENIVKVKRILNFFNEQPYSEKMNNEDNFVSIGRDGYILCDLNRN